MKSEALKASKKMLPNTDKVYLTGRVFSWQYMRDCATDYLKSIGIKEIIFDKNQSILLDGVKNLIEKIGEKKFRNQEKEKLSKEDRLIEYPSFKSLKDKYEEASLYKRISEPEVKEISGEEFEKLPINIGLDVGSTMAKMVIANASDGSIILKSSYDNHGGLS